MKAVELKQIDLDITKINIPQVFGFKSTYTKLAPIKHKRKKINDKWYDTKKSILVYYDNDYTHDNNFDITFVYKTIEGQYFRRTFNHFSEEITIIQEATVIMYLNKQKSLF